LIFEVPFAFLLQINLLEMIERTDALEAAVVGILILFSLFSWTAIFAKWGTLRGARKKNARFLRARTSGRAHWWVCSISVTKRWNGR